MVKQKFAYCNSLPFAAQLFYTAKQNSSKKTKTFALQETKTTQDSSQFTTIKKLTMEFSAFITYGFQIKPNKTKSCYSNAASMEYYSL